MKNSNGESSVRTLERGLEILKLFGEHSSDLSLTDISQQTELNPSTVSRLLASLEKYQFVRRNSENKRYSLGPALLSLNDQASRQTDLRTLSMSYLRALQNKYNESVSIYVEQNGKRVCLDRIESTQNLRRIIIIGEVLTLTRGASGRVLLAWLPKKERARILAEDPYIDESNLAKIRKEGYAVSLEEREVGVFGVSAPVFDVHGKLVAALAMSGPISRLDDKLQEEYVQELCRIAMDMSRELGYTKDVLKVT